MDACDPTINIKDLKTLIKQYTGANLKLSTVKLSANWYRIPYYFIQVIKNKRYAFN